MSLEGRDAKPIWWTRDRRSRLWWVLVAAVLWVPVSRLAWWLWAVNVSIGVHPSTDMSILERVVPPADAQLVRIYDGLPHQMYEPGELFHDLFLTRNRQIGGWRFHSDGNVPSPDSVGRLSAAFRSPKMYREYGGPALCGGYHPDYCYEWHSSKGVFYTLICLGCSGLTLIGADGEALFCDLGIEAFNEVEMIVDAPPAFPLRVHRGAGTNRYPTNLIDHPELVSSIVEDPRSLPGVVVDETSAVLAGAWVNSEQTLPYVGIGYIHTHSHKETQDWGMEGASTATFRPELGQAGLYEVRLAHGFHERHANNVLVTIRHAEGETQLRVNQQERPPLDSLFRVLGRFRFAGGSGGWVRISDAGIGENEVVVADAVQWVPVAGP